MYVDDPGPLTYETELQKEQIMKIYQRVEVVKTGNVPIDTVLPSGDPYGKLIGMRGVVVGLSKDCNGGWIVQFDHGNVYTLYD